MKILVVSDVVENRIYSDQLKKNFSDVDLVLSAGDLPYSYLEYIVSVLNKPLLYVNGNHDNKEYTSDGHVKHECLGCINVHAKSVSVLGLVVVGFEGSMRYNRGPFQYTEGEMRWNQWKIFAELLLNRLKTGRYCDILLTHAPPYRIGDLDTRAHVGFKTFLDFIDNFRPKLHIHGHVHLYDRNEPFIRQYKETKIINAYGFKVIDFDPATSGIKIVQN